MIYQLDYKSANDGKKENKQPLTVLEAQKYGNTLTVKKKILCSRLLLNNLYKKARG